MHGGLLKIKFLGYVQLLACLIFTLAEPTFSNSTETQSNCITTFRATTEQITTAHQEVLQNYFGPKRIFTTPFFKSLAKLEKQTPIDVYRQTLSQFDPSIIRAETGLQAVKALIEINERAKGLGLSPQQYLIELRATLPLHRSRLHQEITQTILNDLVPSLNSLLNGPSSGFSENATHKDLGWAGSALIGAWGYGILGAVLSGGPGLTLLGALSGVSVLGPFTHWISSGASYSFYRKVGQRNLYDRNRLISIEEINQKWVGSEFSNIPDIPTEAEFASQIDGIVNLAKEEFRLITLLYPRAKTESKLTGLPLAIKESDKTTQERFMFIREQGKKKIEAARSILELLKRLNRSNPATPDVVLPSTDPIFSLVAIENGEAIAAFRSSSGWLKRRNYLTPVIILGQGKSPNSWLATSSDDFNDALKFRNDLSLFELKYENLIFDGKLPTAITTYKSGDPRLLRKHGSHHNAILLPPELKTEMAENPETKRKRLRDFLLQKYLNQ